jgi:two-component system osmolarity sensor histidine kinase EnvZ
VTLRVDAFKRLLVNLLSNAARHGEQIAISAHHEGRWLTVHVDDDGPGIPVDAREEVFKPFVRLDEARNQDESGSGLGLAIARDIARSHGGEVTLADSPLGAFAPPSGFRPDDQAVASGSPGRPACQQREGAE